MRVRRKSKSTKGTQELEKKSRLSFFKKFIESKVKKSEKESKATAAKFTLVYAHIPSFYREIDLWRRSRNLRFSKRPRI